MQNVLIDIINYNKTMIAAGYLLIKIPGLLNKSKISKIIKSLRPLQSWKIFIMINLDVEKNSITFIHYFHYKFRTYFLFIALHFVRSAMLIIGIIFPL